MKRTCFCLLLFLILSLGLRGQVRFSKYYDYNHFTELAADVIPLGDSGYFFVSQSIDHTQEDTLNAVVSSLCFFRIDINGDTLWTKPYRKKGYFITGTQIVKTSFGYLFTGSEVDLVAKKENNIGSNTIIWALDINGDTLYTRNYSVSIGDETPTRIIATNDGYAVYGQSCNQTSNNCDYFLMKLDSSGNRQWTKTYTQTSASFENPTSLLQDDNGNFFLFGYSTISGIMKWFLAKANTQGNLLWKRVYNEYPRQAGSGIIKLNDGSILLIGGNNSNISGTGNGKGCIMKIDTSGAKIWSKSYGDKAEHLYSGISEDNGEITLVGTSRTFDTLKAQSCGWFLRINGIGDSLFQRIYNVHPIWPEILYSIKRIEDGYIMAGTSVNPSDASTKVDAWLLKVDNWGCLEEGCQNTGIAYENTSAQIAVYPNPATNNLSLTTSLKLVSYNIFNHYGVLVSSGSITENAISVGDLVPGLYIIRLMGADNTFSTAKFVKD